jgi:hypothetical protein
MRHKGFSLLTNKWLTISLSIMFMICNNLAGQVTIEGLIINEKGTPLSRINIIVYQPGTTSVIAFAVSTEQGTYRTNVDSPTDSLQIEASSVQYRNEKKTIANKSQIVNFILEDEVMELDSIIVKAPLIQKRGDTLSYLVSSFAGASDRSIEDVLKRMPGIEVETDGRILYQGLPIKKFYVEGLDLMEGRYGVISKNLPHGSVSVVEIMENHQPIHILEVRVASYQASLNIKLKKGVAATGTAKLGAGYAPLLWDVNLTPMLFSKGFQLLGSWQTNNVGNDVSQQLQMKTLDEFAKYVDRPAGNTNLLHIQKPIPPEIEKNRYLDNNIHLLNFNGIQRINRDFQLRTNLFYVNDIQKQTASQFRTQYIPTDTLYFFENLATRLHDHYLHAEFALNRNVKNNYMNNNLVIASGWNDQRGLAIRNNEIADQELNMPATKFSNELRSASFIGKNLVDFQSFILYDNTDNHLAVKPGQFEVILNDGEPFGMVSQQMGLKRFFTDNSAGFGIRWKDINLFQRLGISYRKQSMESSIIKTQNNLEQDAGSQFENLLQGLQTRAYYNTNAEYQKAKWTIKANFPISWYHVDLTSVIPVDGQKTSYFLFEPGLSVNYKINSFWSARTFWSHARRIGDIDQIHYGFILKSYRILTQNAAPISENSRHNVGLYLSYRNPITSFFNSLSYFYSKNKTNQLMSQVVRPDGSTVAEVFYLPNSSYTQSIQGQASKFFTGTKSTLRIKLFLNQHRGVANMNSELFNTTNYFYRIEPELTVRITPWLNADYNFRADYFKTFVENEERSNMSLFKSNLNLFAFPFNNQLISLTTEFYNYHSKANTFMDIMYRYTIARHKIDIELLWSNIFNTKQYTSLNANYNTVWESIYLLRPAQVLVSAKFGF